VRITVADDGSAAIAAAPPSAAPPSAAPPSAAPSFAALPADQGHGIDGMRERAALHRGALRAGPAPGGGWLVEAILRAASP
jgi:hypothetical protein